MRSAPLSKYLAFARISAEQARRERGELFGRVAFFAVILGVFSSLWRAVGEAGMPLGSDSKALVWYLAATEWIYLSAPPVHIEIQETIRRGDIVYRLGRPASYVLSEFASGFGLLAVRAPILAVTACACAFAFTGSIPPAHALLVMVPFGLIAAILLTALYVWIGLLAFWLQDITPVMWVWQKLIFVLGGLMLPLSLYPALVQRIAAFTPFPVVLSAPASIVLGAGSLTMLGVRLAVWGALTATAVSWMFARATRSLSVNGG